MDVRGAVFPGDLSRGPTAGVDRQITGALPPAAAAAEAQVRAPQVQLPIHNPATPDASTDPAKYTRLYTHSFNLSSNREEWFHACRDIFWALGSDPAFRAIQHPALTVDRHHGLVSEILIGGLELRHVVINAVDAIVERSLEEKGFNGTVTIEIGKYGNSTLQCIVSDNGVGIAKPTLGQLFRFSGRRDVSTKGGDVRLLSPGGGWGKAFSIIAGRLLLRRAGRSFSSRAIRLMKDGV